MYDDVNSNQQKFGCNHGGKKMVANFTAVFA
jgi:hypothetical protein